ncbi:MAG: AAA family ATPase, partial [bacterium]|nr:AAA family ATPase [bacterium]
EIEKAHPDVYNMLLQVMEEGRPTDSLGRNVDFRNVILIMTTNAGAQAIKNESSFGYHTATDAEGSYKDMKRRVMGEIEKVFRPEFLNRLDETIIFRHLTQDNLKQVIDLELAKVRERLQNQRGLELILTDDAKEFIIKKGCTKTDYGARPLRRTLENYIEDPLSEELLRGEFTGCDTILVGAVRDDEDKLRRLKFEGQTNQKPADEEPAEVAASGDSGEGESEGEES